MYEYKVLIVDDEYHVHELVTQLLMQIDNVSLDIYTAYNAAEAISLLELGRMDMVITDIEMPGTSGLDLLSYIRTRWKYCRVVILTAFSHFQYAYNALQLRVDGYILKTESDTVIREKLGDMLQSVQNDIRASALYAEKKMQHVLIENKDRLLELLSRPIELSEQQKQLVEMGFSPSADNIFLITCRHFNSEQPLINETILHELLGHYFRNNIHCLELAHTNSNELTWLLELNEKPLPTDANRISGMLEMVQNACHDALSLPLSFVFMAYHTHAGLLYDAYQTICSTFENMSENAQPFIYHLKPNTPEALLSQSIPNATLTWLCSYINEHIFDDLSLIRLSTLTGYNPQSLSSLFSQTFGETLSHYIAQKRLALACKLLSNPDLPIQDIAVRLGFTSHSYFSRFIRKATGLSPQQLRIKLVDATYSPDTTSR